jgi:hypothetical protein
VTTPSVRLASTGIAGRLVRPIELGDRTLPPLGLVILAGVGAVLLITVAFYRWATPSDEHAYWLAAHRLLDGQPLYDPTASPVTPYAYWYPPVVAQVLAPVAAVLPSLVFTAAWTLLLLGCLWWLARGNILVALALVAFPPVAVELWFRNIHLVLAVLLVMAVRGRSSLFPVGAAIKLAPGLGIAWLAGQGRWRAAAAATTVGLVILAASVAISPDAWVQFIQVVGARGPGDVSSFVPIPYAIRATAGLALALVASRLARPWSGVLLVVAVTIALPTLWFTALSTAVGVVAVVRRS